MNWNLIIEDDAGKTIVVPLARDQITIGRKEGNTIRLTERNVSRFHAKLVRENGHVFIEDLKSYNGIKVNGDRISGKIPIQEGDLVEIGDYHLALQAQDAVEPALAGSAPPREARAPVQMKSAALDGPTQTADDDEFAGDTQRWEPPASMDPLPVGNMATSEDLRPMRPLPNSDETAPVPPSHFMRDGQPTLDERMPLSVDTGKISKNEGLPPPHGWPSPQDGAPSFASLESHGQAAPPPPGRGGAQNGAMFQVPLQAEETMRTPRVATEDIPTASPFDVVEDAMPPPTAAPPPPATPPPPAAKPPSSSPGATASSMSAAPTGPAPPMARIPMEPVAPFAKAKGSQPQPASRVHEEQTEALRPAPQAHADLELNMHRLVVLNTVFAGSTFAARSPEMIVGRTDDNDITIEHRSVSRNHAKLIREGERLRISDLKSANGILVNGEEVESAVLRTGDIIELGRVRLRYVPPGERFVVPPEEIERARVADVAGDEFNDEPGTHITSPLRAQATRPPAQRSKLPLIAAAVSIALILVVAIVMVLTKKAPEAPPPPAPEAPTARIDAPAAVSPTLMPPAPPPVQATEKAPEPPPPANPDETAGADAHADMTTAIGKDDVRVALAAFDKIPAAYSKQAAAKGELDAAKKAWAGKLHEEVQATKDADIAAERLELYKLVASPKDKAKVAALEKQVAKLRAAQAKAAADDKKRAEKEKQAAPVESSPTDVDEAKSKVRKATELFMGGDMRGALDMLKQAEAMAPNLPDVHRNLGVVHARVGDKEAAYAAYKRFLELQPTGSDAENVRKIVEQYEAAKGGK